MAGTLITSKLKLNSLHVDDWTMYGRLNHLILKYDENSEHVIEANVPTLNISHISKLYIPNNIFHTKLLFDATKFTQNYSFYGIKLLYSDVPIQTFIYDRFFIQRDLLITQFSASDVEHGIHIVLKYNEKPSSVAFNIYPIIDASDKNGGTYVESYTFGFISM